MDPFLYQSKFTRAGESGANQNNTRRKVAEEEEVLDFIAGSLLHLQQVTQATAPPPLAPRKRVRGGSTQTGGIPFSFKWRREREGKEER